MGTKGYVLKTTRSATDFESLLKSITQKSYLLAQQVDVIRFDPFNSSMKLPDLLKKGRIFNDDFEIRYEKLDDGSYELMIFFEKKEKTQGLNLSGTANEYTLSESLDNIFLWGRAKPKQTKDSWRFIEVRIPQALRYPDVDDLEDGDELVIKACDYKQGELPCFTRFIGVEKYEPQSN